MEGQPLERASDILERTVMVRRDRWALVIGLVDELRSKRGIDASSEEVAGIVLDAGIEAVKASMAKIEARERKRKRVHA